jgi:putative phosphoribosyl transferase
MRTTFRDRTEAGQLLARELRHYVTRNDLLVLGLPRGGVPVAYEVATALHAPLDVFVVRKLGVPGHRELAMGAIATGGVRVLNAEVLRYLDLPPGALDEITAEEMQELQRRELAYRGHPTPPDVRGKTVILVDDGVATGSTMRAAIRALKQQQPARLVVAVPTGALATCDELRREVDELVTLLEPDDFQAVGEWYDDFSQTTDAEVTRLLAQAKESASDASD